MKDTSLIKHRIVSPSSTRNRLQTMKLNLKDVWKDAIKEDFFQDLQHTIASKAVNPNVPRSRTMTVDQRKIIRIQDKKVINYMIFLFKCFSWKLKRHNS